ncbi:MAG: ATP-binding protein [Actinobacteria bacterium]|nr:ATP-binding protein [Actinomycetota bacterium]
MTSAFEGEIRVASTIVDYLSSGLYENPAACLKELINNAYDADASQVDVFVKPDADRIIIEDDGLGFTAEQFRQHFDRVASSTKRLAADTTPSGRKIIGRIGIGLIAANEICEVLEVHSTQPGSTDLMKVEIDFRVMTLDRAQRLREDSADVTKADYRGTITEIDADAHFTRLYLMGIKGRAAEILAGVKGQVGHDVNRSLYGLSPESVARLLADPDLASWDELDAYSETMLQIAQNVPVRYHDSVVRSKRHSDRLEPFFRRAANLGFRVDYDGVDLRKPVVFSGAPAESLVEVFEHTGDHIDVAGYFYAEHGTLRPKELNGVLVRIREAAVGGWDPGFLGYPRQHNALFQKWVSGEVWVSDGLEDAMNIDRRTLRETHPAFVELQSVVHRQVRKITGRARSELYGQKARVRKARRAEREIEAIRSVVSEAATELRRPQRQQLEERVSQVLDDPDAMDRLGRSYSISSLFRLVVEVASEELEPVVRERFLARLLTRLMDR